MQTNMKTRTITRDELIAMTRPEPPTVSELDAVRRLLKVAQSDTGQSRLCANFLLAWWNGQSCGGFNLVDLWGLDRALALDMLAVFGLIARCHDYPPALDPALDAPFRALVGQWRPALVTEA